MKLYKRVAARNGLSGSLNIQLTNGYGYFAGGYSNGVTNDLASIEKLSFLTLFITTILSVLTLRRGGMATAKSLLKGFFVGGYYSMSGASLNIIENIVFATDVVLRLGATLPVNMIEGSGVQSNENAYFTGGNSVGSTIIDSVYKVQFSSETVTPAAIGFNYSDVGANSFSTDVEGIFCCGKSYSLNTRGLIFSTNSKVYYSNSLKKARYLAASVYTNTHGYLCCGDYYGNASEEFNYSTHTAVELASATAAVHSRTAGASSQTNGFIAGGGATGSSASGNIDGLLFSTKTFTSLSSTLTAIRGSHSGISAA